MVLKAWTAITDTLGLTGKRKASDDDISQSPQPEMQRIDAADEEQARHKKRMKQDMPRSDSATGKPQSDEHDEIVDDSEDELALSSNRESVTRKLSYVKTGPPLPKHRQGHQNPYHNIAFKAPSAKLSTEPRAHGRFEGDNYQPKGFVRDSTPGSHSRAKNEALSKSSTQDGPTVFRPTPSHNPNPSLSKPFEASQLDELRSELAQKDADLRTLRIENAGLKDLNAHQQSQLTTMKEMSDALESTSFNLSNESLAHETTHSQLAFVQSELNAAKAELRTAQQEYSTSQRQCDELHICQQRTERTLEKTRRLLQTRTEELDLAQAFMTTADRVSVSDVKRKVIELNEEIFQLASMLSGHVLESYDEREEGKSTSAAAMWQQERAWQEYLQGARKQLVGKWNEWLVARLEAEARAGESMLLESLLQNQLAYRSWSMIKRFHYSKSDVEGVFRDVWDRVKSSCEPSIARNWLSITSSNLKHQPPPDSSTTLQTLVHLLAVCGLHLPFHTIPIPPEPSTVSSNHPEVAAAASLMTLIAQKIEETTAKTLLIKRMVTEDVLSAELEVTNHQRGAYNAAVMEDAFDFDGAGLGPASANALRVICGTALGLNCHTTPRKDQSTSSSSSGAANVASRKTETILKCKVLLNARLDEAEREREKERQRREREMEHERGREEMHQRVPNAQGHGQAGGEDSVMEMIDVDLEYP